jgi:hypothetical protein
MKNELMKHEAIPQKNQNELKDLPDIQGEKINENYRILQKGALKYIVNEEGKVVSEGYHEFKVFKHNDIMALAGKTGATQKLLKMPQSLDNFFEESPAEFHEINFDDELGLMIVSKGAMSYILDMQTGQEISKGYHKIVKKGGRLYGQTGATEEEIKLFSPKQISDKIQVEHNNK